MQVSARATSTACSCFSDAASKVIVCQSNITAFAGGSHLNQSGLLSVIPQPRQGIYFYLLVSAYRPVGGRVLQRAMNLEACRKMTLMRLWFWSRRELYVVRVKCAWSKLYMARKQKLNVYGGGVIICLMFSCFDRSESYVSRACASNSGSANTRIFEALQEGKT